MEIKEIKDILLERVKKYDVENIINPIEITLCNTKENLLLFLFRNNNIVKYLIEQRIIYSDLLLQMFSKQELQELNIYTDGNIKLFGTKTYYILGNCIATIYNDAHVFSYENAQITLRQKAMLYAYGNTTFKACDNSQIITNGININGTLHGHSIGEINNCHGNVTCYEYSNILANSSSNIFLYDYSKIKAINNSTYINLHDKSEAVLCNNSNAICYDNSVITSNDSSFATLYDNSMGYFNNNSNGRCFSAREITCRDKSNVDVYQNVKYTNLYGNSVLRILEMGTKLRAYENSIVLDFADIYTEALDNAIIIWMNRHQIFKNQQKYSANVPFDYTDEQKCK